MLKKINRRLATREVLFLLMLIEIIGAYVFASLAIDNGRILEYLLAFLFLFVAINNLIKIINLAKKKKDVSSKR